MSAECYICRKPIDRIFIFTTSKGSYKMCQECMKLARKIVIKTIEENEALEKENS